MSFFMHTASYCLFQFTFETLKSYDKNIYVTKKKCQAQAKFKKYGSILLKACIMTQKYKETDTYPGYKITGIAHAALEID